MKYFMQQHHGFHFLQISLQGDDDDETDTAASIPEDYAEMDIDTIMNGKVWHKIQNNTYNNNYMPQGAFPGLIPLMRMYVNSLEVDVDTRCTIQQYLKLIQKRASGQCYTDN